MITNKEIRMLQAIWKREGKVADEHIAAKKIECTVEQRNIIVAQNIIRDVLTATLNEMAPFSEDVPLELSIRVSSYLVSVLPPDRHFDAMLIITESLPAAHHQRMQAGVMIRSEWSMGHAEPVKKGDLN